VVFKFYANFENDVLLVVDEYEAVAFLRTEVDPFDDVGIIIVALLAET